MSIKESHRYAKLRADGNPTLSERMEMLVQHRQVLNGQIGQFQEHMTKLDEKIAFYRKEIKRVNNGFIETGTYNVRPPLWGDFPIAAV